MLAIVIARLLRSADFERVLRTRGRASSAHFAIHHVAGRPSIRQRPVDVELSTGEPQEATIAVDDGRLAACPESWPAIWLGAVVPKRHARRAVTRTLVKRQIREVVRGHGSTLADGLWVVRLRAPFDRTEFASAASDALKHAVRSELEHLMRGAALRTSAGV